MACRLTTVLVAAALAQACDREADERPPTYTAEPPQNLYSCAELLRHPSLAVRDDFFFAGGEPAQCAVTGLVCPLDPSLSLQNVDCPENETPFALCSMDRWRLACARVAPPAGTAGTAGTAALPTAGQSQGPPGGGSSDSEATAGRTP